MTEVFLEKNVSFGDYQKNFGKQFVALMLSDKSSKGLRGWCEKAGFDLTKDFSGKDIEAGEFDFHTTVFYTSNEVYLKSGQFTITPIQLMPLGFDLFGKNKNIPVLKINPDSQHLKDFRVLFQSQGLEDAWPEWKPHVSLSYNFGGGNIDHLGPGDIPFPLFADQVVIKKSS